MNEKVAQALCDANVVKLGSFQLASGRESPVYIDLRILPSYPKAFKAVTDEFSALIKELKMDIVAGVETAGIPISTAISIKTKIPMIYVRRRPKGYGTNSMIEGIIDKGQKVVLIDDLITNGGSKLRFIDGVKQADAKVNDVAVILDRGQGGKEMLDGEGIKLHSLITLKELLGYMREHSLISKEEYTKVLEYLDQNEQTN
jgi:uridine monophosphate synthetase|tara:strand:+ start:49 stop:651 length:603 start_codon:yes stop_codon:yes gene_type:complete